MTTEYNEFEGQPIPTEYDRLQEEKAHEDIELPPLTEGEIPGDPSWLGDDDMGQTPAHVFELLARRRGILVQLKADFPDAETWELLQMASWIETGELPE